MPGLADSIARLKTLPATGLPANFAQSGGRLSPLTDFGTNPGQLRAKVFVPDALPVGAPLVVVLHGCTQTAEGYDRGSGWSQIAQDYGFALLYPEQQRSNNANLCFNWFEPGDVRRGDGEAMSIRQMVTAMVDTHDLDPARIFVTGLSAGGAMTSVMLACYPEVFAGGAIIAGLPYGAASNVSEALRRMRAAGAIDVQTLSRKVAAASAHKGPWPTLSVWHGDADATVDLTNGTAIVEQWRGVHGVEATPSSNEATGTHTHRVWRNAKGRDVIEFWAIKGMGHGTPLAASGPHGCGTPGPYIIEVGISSTRQIARLWELDTLQPTIKHAPIESNRPSEPTPRVAPARRTLSFASGPGKIIEDALRAAGLIR